MSTTEPRPLFGDGPPGVRAAAAVTGPVVFAPTGSASEGQNPSVKMPGDSSEPSILPATFVVQATTALQPDADDRDALPPLLSLSDLILEAPAWLFSAALHMIAVIILGLLFIVPERPLEILLRLDDQDGFEELSGTEFDLDLEVAEASEDAAMETQEVVNFEDPVLIEPTEIEPLVLDSQSLVVSAPIQMALAGRSQGMQQKLLDAYGGTASTQRAVMMALRWLERNQASRGLWSLTGNYTDGARIENREAATGMALLAFQGAGYTPHSPITQPNGAQHDFTKVTAKAWKSLLRKQNDSGSFFNAGGNTSQLYTQAICTIAICELYGMTRDSSYHDAAQRAVDFCVRIQAAEGGWRYYPGTDSDLSVTGWFAMALQSARMAGLDVPTPTLKRVSGFLDSVSSQGGIAYGYRPNNQATQSMTAEGLLCRQYLGWSQSDPRLRRGAQFLIENLPAWQRGDRDVYYWYYATQVCHHMEGNYWRTWNDAMKVVLPENQVQAGRERGSWDPNGDEWGGQGGRLYVTCLSTFMLEVYYRHLPIYKADILNGGF